MKSNDINKLTEPVYKGEETNINFDFMKNEANQAKEAALTEIMAGVPTIPEPTVTVSHESIQEAPVTEGYTVRDQVMSRLNLLDPETNTYTDTYTNYVQQGGTPPPGYEYAHKELLHQEKIDDLFKQVDEGTLSTDAALMEAYGRDILATNYGIDVTSTAYWKNKYFSDDFSDPFDNRYLMSSVLALAEQEHTKRQQSEYASSSVKSTTLAALAGQEVDDLTSKKIKDLFPSLQNVDTDDDTAFWKAVHTGQISASMRLTQDKDGTYYYLHTDGRLHVLDGKKEDGHGTIHFTDDGQLESINLNNVEIWHIGRAFISGATNVIKSTADFLSIPLSVITGNNWDTFANAIDEWAADDLWALVDTGYIDLNSRITGDDIGAFLAQFAGQVAGTLALGSVSGYISNAGSTLTQAGYELPGTILDKAGTVLKWQTGNFGSYSGAITTGQVWGRRLGAATVANLKNFTNTVRNNYIQAALYDERATDQEIIGRSAAVFAANTLIDTLISGGMDDNQLQAYKRLNPDSTSSLDFLGMTVEEVAAKKAIIDTFTKTGQQALTNEIKENAKKAVKDLMWHRAYTIGANSAMDFVGNLLTGAIGSVDNFKAGTATFDSDIMQALKNGFTLDNVGRSVLSTLWYSTRSQIKEWNTGLETIEKSHTDFINEINLKLKTATPEEREALTEYKRGYLQAIDNSTADTIEGRIIAGFNFLAGDSDTLPKSLVKIVEKNASDKSLDIMRKLYIDCSTIYSAQQARAVNLFKVDSSERKMLLNHVLTKNLRKAADFLSGEKGARDTFDKQTNASSATAMNFLKELTFYDSDYATQLFQLTSDTHEDTKHIETKTTEDPEIKAKYGDSIYQVIPNQSTRDKSYYVEKATLDIATNLGYLELADEDKGIYVMRPFENTLAGLNQSAVIEAIKETTYALSSSKKTPQEKSEIIQNLAGALTSHKATPVQKSLIIGGVLDKLMNTYVGDSKKPLVSEIDGINIFLDLKQKTGFKSVNFDDKNTNDTIRRLSKACDEYVLYSQGKADLIDLSDDEVLESFKLMKEQEGISKEDYENLIKFIEDNKSFISGSHLKSKENFIKHVLQTVSPEKYETEELEHMIKLYLGDQDIKDTEAYKEIIKTAELYDSIMSGTKTVTLDQDTVYIDLTRFHGKEHDKLTKDLALRISSGAGISDLSDLNVDGYRLTSEYKNYMKVAAHNNQIVSFNINTESKELISFMKDFGYTINPNRIKEDLSNIVGVHNARGDSIVLDIDMPEHVEDIKEAILKTGKLKINKNMTLDFRKLNSSLKGFNGTNIDIDNAILNSIELTNIDPRVGIVMKQAPGLYAMPFIMPSDKTDLSYTTPLVNTLMGLDAIETLGKLAGKASKDLGTQREHLMINSAGALLQVDEQLADFFTLDFMCRTLLDNKSRTVINLSEDEYIKLRDSGLVNYTKGSHRVNEPNNFWRILEVGDQYNLMLDYKGDDTLHKMHEYMTSKDFNVYRLLPILFKESNVNRQGIVDLFSNVSTEGTEELLPGMERNTGLLSVLSTRLPWDTDDNKYLADFIMKLIDHQDELNYNPLKGSGYTAPNLSKTTSDSFDDWYSKAKDSKDPYDIINVRLIDTFDKMVYGQEGQDSYNNEDILLFNRGTRKLLLDVINKGADVDANLIKDIKKILAYAPKKYISSNEDISSSGFYRKYSDNDENTIAIGPKSIAVSRGDDNLEVKNTDWIDMPTVQKAIDKIISIQTNEEDAYRQKFVAENTILTFEENDATKLLKGLVGNNSYIPVDDVDAYADLIFENWKEFVDNITPETRPSMPKIKNDMIPILKYLYGNNYEEQFARKVFNSAINQAKILNQNRANVSLLEKHRVSPSAASMQKDSVSAVGLGETADAEGNLHAPLVDGTIDRNYDEFYDRVKGGIEAKLRENKVSRMLNNANAYMNNELYDLAHKELLEYRNLYSTSPWNTESDNLISAYNNKGLMLTVFNTFKELKPMFSDEQKSMDLAKAITYLNVGVDYASDTVQWFIVNNDGSFKDSDNLLEKYGSANMNELLFNINKSKEDLKGKTLLYTTHQSMDNTAGIHIEYKRINTDEDLNEITQELFHNYLLSNSWVFKDAHSQHERDVLIDRILSKEISSEEIQALLDKIPSDRVSKLQANKNTYHNWLDRTQKFITRSEFNGVLKDLSSIATNELTEEAIEGFFGKNSGEQNKHLEIINYLITGLGNPEYYSSDKLKALNDYIDDLKGLKKVPEVIKDEDGNEKLADLSTKDILFNEVLDYLTNSYKAPALDFLVHDRSFEQMEKEIRNNNVENGVFLGFNSKGDRTFMDTLELKNLVDSFVKGDTSLTDYEKIISLDTETFLKLIDGSEKVMSIGYVLYTKTPEGWEKSRHKFYVDYAPEDTDVIENKKFRQNLVDKYINDNEGLDIGSRRFREEEGYQQDIKDYLNASGDKLRKPYEIKKILSDIMLSGKTAFIGHNISNADLGWLKNSGIIDDNMFEKTQTIDTMYLREVSSDPRLSGTLSKDELSARLGISNNSAHESLNDAETTFELFLRLGEMQYDLSKIRNKVYYDIKNNLEGIKYNEDELRSALQEIENTITGVRLNHTDLENYFDKAAAINTDTVSAATDIFEYVINKKMFDYMMTLNNTEDVYLSDEAIKSLYANQQDFISKVFSIAQDKGNSLENVVYAFVDAIKQEGPINSDSLLKVLNSPVLKQSILDKLEITQDEVDNKTLNHYGIDSPEKMFPNMKSQFETYKNTSEVFGTINHVKDIVKACGVKDLDTINILTKRFFTPIAIADGYDIDDVLKENMHPLETTFYKTLMSTLDKNVGDVDSIVRKQYDGLYDLIDATPVGKPMLDAISGKTITVDSSMCVISPLQFKTLTKMSVEEYVAKHPEILEEGLYSSIIIHPADLNHKTISRRIVVDKRLNGYEIRIPETVLEVMGSRDLDGDHTVLLTPDPILNHALKLLTDNMFKTHDIQEKVLNFLREEGTDNGYLKDFQTQFLIGEDEDVLRLCYEADAYLEKGKDVPDELTKEFESVVSKIIEANDYDVKPEDVVKDLWVKTANIYELDRSVDSIKYINNLALDRDKDDASKLSYSAKMRYEIEAKQYINKDSSYAPIDQYTGVVEKESLGLLHDIEILDPYKDLLSNGIYASKVVEKYFENYEGDYDKFGSELTKYITESYGEETAKHFNDGIKQIVSSLKSGNTVNAFVTYDLVLKALDTYNRKSLDGTELLEELKSPQMIEYYERMQQQFAAANKMNSLRTQLMKNRSTVFSGRSQTDLSRMLTQDALRTAISESNARFNQNIYLNNSFKGNAFVITSFGKIPEDQKAKYIGTGEQIKTPYKILEEAYEYNMKQYNAKVKLLKTKHSQNPATPDLIYKELPVDDIKESMNNYLDKAQKIKAKQDKLKNTSEYYEKTIPNENYVDRSWKETVPSISEDTVLVNRSYKEKPHGYYQITMHSEVNDDISPSKNFIKAGTVVCKDGSKLPYDASYVGHNTFIASVPIDSSFKITTENGGKGVANGSFSTDEDYLFVINNANLKKTTMPSNIPVKDKTLKSLVIYDEHNNPFIVYGYNVGETAGVATEATRTYRKDKQRNYDLLHYVMDNYTAAGLLYGAGGTINKDGNLSTNIKQVQDITPYAKHDYVQAENQADTVTFMRLLAVFNVMNDKEILDYFGGDDAEKVKYEQLHNKLLSSKKMNDVASTLGEMYKDRLDLSNPIIAKLFDPKLEETLYGQYVATATDKDIDLNKMTSKTGVATKTNLTDEGIDKAKYSSTVKGHKDVDILNADKNLENTEELFTTIFDLNNYLFGDNYLLDSNKIVNLIKNKKMLYGRFIPKTANPKNNFNHFSTRYTIKDSDEVGLIKSLTAPYESVKTAITTTPFENVSVKPTKLKGSAIPARYKLDDEDTKEDAYLNNSILSVISDSTIDHINAGSFEKVSELLHQASYIPRNASIKNKKDYLSTSKNTYYVPTGRLSLGVNEDGDLKLSLTNLEVKEGSLKELNEDFKKLYGNYLYYKTVNRGDNDTHIDESKIKKQKSKYKSVDKEKQKAILTSIYNDLYKATGEVNVNADLSSIGNTGKVSTLETPRVLTTGEKQEFGTSIWGRQGLKPDKELSAQLDTSMKNAYAASIYIEQDGQKALANLQQSVSGYMDDDEFERFTQLSAIAHESNKDIQEKLIHKFGFEDVNISKELQSMAEQFPKVAQDFLSFFTTITAQAKKVSAMTNTPYDTLIGTMMCPYVGERDKEYNKSKAYSVLHDLTHFEKYSPISEVTKQYSNMVPSFFNCAKSFVKELANIQGAHEIKKCLYENKLLSNKELIDGVYDIFNKLTSDEEAYYWIDSDKTHKELMSYVFDEVYALSGVRIKARYNTNIGKSYIDGLKEISSNLDAAMAVFNSRYGTDYKTYSEFRNASEFTENMQLAQDAKGVSNIYYAKILIGQAMIQGSTKLANEIGKNIQNLYANGYTLVNAWGQEIKRNGIVRPIGPMPFQNIVENCEIQYNSHSEAMWNQYVLEKILSGDLYTMRSDVAEHLNTHFYTKENPEGVKKALLQVSKLSAGLQMSLPGKMLNRLLSFTGFDYSMGIMYDPKVIKNIGRARREIMGAYLSHGTQMTDEFRTYLMKEGQPIGLTGKDPITFSEDMTFGKVLDAYMNQMTDPLEIQNHLGRYAIYLTALEGFKNGDPNYGPLYYAKDSIDKLKTDEDKAMYIMDYMLGSPGGFPDLAKKTSGVMLYATFPLNFARTMGAYGMTLGKLFEEGFTQENTKQWMRCAIVPSMGLVGITAVGSVLWAWICSLLGLDEEESKEYVYSLSSPDLIGTTLSGLPQKSSSSMNPVENAYSMTIEPFTNTNNKTIPEKLLGLINTNITSHLNPAIKEPIQWISGYDNFGSSIMNTKNSYTGIENGTKKALSFVLGSGVATNLVDQYKIDQYSNNRNLFDSFKLGFGRGVAYDFGNEKTYKRDLTNYYNNISKIRNFQYKISNGNYNNVEDYIEADSMERIRNTKSKYGVYNSDDYQRINNLLKKAIKKREPASTVYSIIINAYNSGVDEKTLVSVLYNNSLARKLEALGKNKELYLNSLSATQYAKLVKALQYEEFMYPYLKEFFPKKVSSSGYTRKYPTYRQIYSSSGSSSSRPYYPKAPTGSYVNYYPNSSNKKVQYNKAKSSIDKVEVKVSPQMGVWKNDYNETQSLSTYNKNKNKNPVKLLDKNASYINNPYYNNLSNYEKRKKSGN